MMKETKSKGSEEGGLILVVFQNRIPVKVMDTVVWSIRSNIVPHRLIWTSFLSSHSAVLYLFFLFNMLKDT